MNQILRTPTCEKELDLLLSEPSSQLVQAMQELPGDITILGANGKIGLSLAHIAKKAAVKAGTNKKAGIVGAAKKIYAVSRFSDIEGKEKLESWGVETITCDLLDQEQVKKLPHTENVIFMAGRKFGTIGSEPLTWAMNTLVPANCAAHYKDSRTVVFSTGCVYPLTTAASGGSVETDTTEPIGEYSQSCLCRERIFEHFSIINKTPTLLYRLNYATDLRYGVLYDIGIKIWNNEPITTGIDHFNIIWQGDANNIALLSLLHTSSPANILNVTGEDILSVTTVANEMAEIMQKPVEIISTGNNRSFNRSYLNNASKSFTYFGKPSVSSKDLIRMQAEWIMNGGRGLNKPTHFEVDNGKF
jgi:hypothetical protein